MTMTEPVIPTAPEPVIAALDRVWWQTRKPGRARIPQTNRHIVAPTQTGSLRVFCGIALPDALDDIRVESRDGAWPETPLPPLCAKCIRSYQGAPTLQRPRTVVSALITTRDAANPDVQTYLFEHADNIPFALSARSAVAWFLMTPHGRSLALLNHHSFTWENAVQDIDPETWALFGLRLRGPAGYEVVERGEDFAARDD